LARNDERGTSRKDGIRDFFNNLPEKHAPEENQNPPEDSYPEQTTLFTFII
jgi:hypothetical protein